MLEVNFKEHAKLTASQIPEVNNATTMHAMKTNAKLLVVDFIIQRE
jgi:hypothetical protein